MTDRHQVATLIAKTICECHNDQKRRLDPEEAKQIAVCILEALTAAGLQIVPGNCG
jgi:hypothetical protein